MPMNDMTEKETSIDINSAINKQLSSLKVKI